MQAIFKNVQRGGQAHTGHGAALIPFMNQRLVAPRLQLPPGLGCIDWDGAEAGAAIRKVPVVPSEVAAEEAASKAAVAAKASIQEAMDKAEAKMNENTETRKEKAKRKKKKKAKAEKAKIKHGLGKGGKTPAQEKGKQKKEKKKKKK